MFQRTINTGFKIFLLALLLHSFCQSQVQLDVIAEPWEPGEENIFEISQINQHPPTTNFIFELLDNSISFYQKNIAQRSIHRCPFKISCSAFAKTAISQYGIVGLAMFLDRYYFRENKLAFIYYKRVEEKNGILKLDDSPFLFR